MKQRRVSNSPLMDPSVCAVVLIAPDARGLASTVAASRPGLQRTLSAIMKAAGIADVPVFILSRDAQQQAVSLPTDIGIASSARPICGPGARLPMVASRLSSTPSPPQIDRS